MCVAFFDFLGCSQLDFSRFLIKLIPSGFAFLCFVPLFLWKNCLWTFPTPLFSLTVTCKGFCGWSSMLYFCYMDFSFLQKSLKYLINVNVHKGFTLKIMSFNILKIQKCSLYHHILIALGVINQFYIMANLYIKTWRTDLTVKLYC